MTDKKLITADDITVPVQFVNQLANAGFLNGVVNMCFSVARFTPDEDGEIDPNLVIVANLRMDLHCAQELRDALTKIIDANTKPARATEH